MKASLKILSFILAVAVPSALFAQFNGASLPALTNPGYLFIAFVAALTMLTVVADYTRSNWRQPLPRAHGRAYAEIVGMCVERSANRLAA